MRLLLTLLKMILCLQFSGRPPTQAKPLVSSSRADSRRLPLVVVVEGSNDVEFLRRISETLHRTEPSVPDLAQLESRGQLIFLPIGGGDLRLWAVRFAGLGTQEFHLFDSEAPPETASRRLAADIVNQRQGCRAVVMSKRSIENYLDPQAIRETLGVEVTFSDNDSVAEAVAQRLFALEERHVSWHDLPPRSRKRRRERVKKRLNTEAASRISPERLSVSDPKGEVRSWLAEIARLVQLRR